MNEHDSLVSNALNNMSLNELAHTYADLKLKVKAMQAVVDAAKRAREILILEYNHRMFVVNFKDLQDSLDALDGETK